MTTHIEKRRYQIKGFRDDGDAIRVLLSHCELVNKKNDDNEKNLDMMWKDPMGVAKNLMNQGMRQMINDSFSISRGEYLAHKYLVGEIVVVTMERET